MLINYFAVILFLLFASINITGNKVSAPKPEPNILIAISKPKFCIGSICANNNIKNPAATETTFIITALPFVIIVCSIAFSASPFSFK